MGFVDRLRMSNIFPSGGSNPLQPPPPTDDGLGLYDSLASRQIPWIQYENDQNRQHESQMQQSQLNSQMRLQQIAQAVKQQATQQQPMNVLYKPDISAYQSGQLSLGRDRLRETSDQNDVRNQLTGENTNIKGELADLKVKNQNLTDEQKATAKATADKDLLKTKGEQAKDNIVTKADQDKIGEDNKQKNRVDLQNMRAGDLGSIEDPNDPTKRISVWYNPDTKKIERVNFEGKDTGPINKPGTDKPVVVSQSKQKVKDMAKETLDSLNELIDDKGVLKDDVATSVGMSRWLDPRNYISGTSAKTGDRKMDNFLSKQLLGILGEMKSQSKTGATGFGALNLKELGVLEKAANSISKDMPDEDIAKILSEIRPKLQKVLEDGNDNDESEPMEKTQTNQRTGEKRTVVSTDGGKTWQPK